LGEAAGKGSDMGFMSGRLDGQQDID